MSLAGGRVRAWSALVGVLASTALVATVSAASPAVAAEPTPLPTQADSGAEAAGFAKRSGKRVEVLGKRTESAQLFANPDGSETAVMATGPVRFRDGKGAWHDIDLTTRASADGSVTATAAEQAATLPSTAAGGVTVPSSAGPITITHPGAAAVAPVLSGSTVTYPGAVGGRDLVQQLLVHGVEETVVLASAGDSPSYTTAFTLPAGVTASARAGGVEFTDGQGRALGHFGEGLAFDDAGAHAAVQSTLVGQVGRTATVSVGVSPAWAGAPERQGKIHIDPVYTWSTSSGGSSDSYVSQAAATGVYYGASSEIRVGYFSATDLSRGLVQFGVGSLVGTNTSVQSASLSLFNVQTSSGCVHNATTLYPNQAAWGTGNVTWTNKPATDTQSAAAVAFGGAPCPTGNVNFDITGLARNWVDKTSANFRPNFGLTIQGPETATSGWKKFKSAEYGSNPPTITITYNRRPNTPSSTATTPPTSCATGAGRPFLNTTTPKFTATIADLDSVNSRAKVEIWPTGGSSPILTGNTPGGMPSVPKSWTVPAGTPLSNGSTYSWRAQGDDGQVTSLAWTGFCEFTVDTTAPAFPSVGSSTYPVNTWQGTDAPAVFSFSSTGHSDVATWAYRFDTGSFKNVAGSVGAANSATSVTVDPPTGWQTLHVVAIDRAGNRSPESTYSFGAATSLTRPADGSATQGSTKLFAVTGPGANSVWYAYRLSDADSWVNVPQSAVTYPAGGNPPVPVGTVAGSFGTQTSPDLNLNVAALLTPSGGQSVDGTVQLKADFYNSGNYVWSSPVSTVALNQNSFGDSLATEQVGPGSVSLLTGNYSVSSTDASVSSYGSDLTVSRTFNSRTPSGDSVFGQGWTASLGVDDAGSDFTRLTDTGAAVTLTSGDGSVLAFAKRTGGYTGTGDAEGLKLVAGAANGAGPGSFTLTDPDGNKTVFTGGTWGAGATLAATHDYTPSQVVQPGNGQTTSYTYATLAGAARPVRLLAPVAPGSTCPAYPATFSGTTQLGCRALDVVYTTLTGGQLRVDRLVLHTTDGAGTGVDTTLAQYSYDGNGRLASSWDPRTLPNALPVTYGYDAAGRLGSITPPGLAAWTLGYDGSGRFVTATRTHSGGGSEVDRVGYGLPVTAVAGTDSSRPDLSAAAAGQWGQTDLPVTAVAVYGPGDSDGATNGGDYRDATVHALNVDGREVNSATFSGTGQAGWRIDTTEYDDQGRVVRTLDAANRDRALRRSDAPAVTVDLPPDTAAAARMLDTTNLYALNPNDTSVETGTQQDLVDTFGPLHLTVVPDSTRPEGVLVAARAHSHTDYDTGNETGHPAPTGQSLHLSTVSWTEASASPGVYFGTAPTGVGFDRRSTTSSYTLNAGADSTGWTFRTPLQTTVQPGGGAAAITTSTVLNPDTGMVVKTSQPSDTATTGIGTTATTYYGIGLNNSLCQNSAWYMQVCKTGPAAQLSPRPAGMPELPVTSTTYDALLRPQTITQTVIDAAGAQQTRTTTTSYENGGTGPRALSTSSTSSISSGAQLLPTVTTTYDTSTGLPISVSASGAGSALTTGYDDFGRVFSFTDADNATTTTSYDGNGRVASTSEVFGGQTLRTTTLGYDGTTPSGGVEKRGLVTSSTTTGLPGAFTAAYDGGGNLLTQNYPSGPTATWTTDETGDSTQLTYAKAGADWFADTQRSNIHGQWRTHDGLPSTQIYTYDGAGRLTEARDSSKTDLDDWDCQTRRYTFDVNSNRTGLTTYGPSSTDGSCQTGTASTVTLGYDAADRLLSSGRAAGITYDAWGRTLNLPAALTTVGGTGGTAVSHSYYANDLVLSQTSGTTTRTWQLDATQQRFRTFTDNSTGTTVTKTNHYSDPSSDSPDWIDEGNSTQTRYTPGLDGNLAATDTRNTSNGVVSGLVYNLTNLHGDLVTTATSAASTAPDGAAYDTDEYGNQKTASPGRYGWLGGKQRSADTTAGLTLMGVRVYSPVAGRFLQVDPVAGGSASSYDYSFADPVNVFDLDGRCPPCAVGLAIGARVALRYGAQRVGSYMARRAVQSAAKSAVRQFGRQGFRTLSRAEQKWLSNGRHTNFARGHEIHRRTARILSRARVHYNTSRFPDFRFGKYGVELKTRMRDGVIRTFVHGRW